MINIAKGNEFIISHGKRYKMLFKFSIQVNVFSSVSIILEYFCTVLSGASVVKFKLLLTKIQLIQFIAQNKPPIGNLFYRI